MSVGSFPELVASLNKIDERIKLLIFYQNLEDCELSEEEIITVIEREYFVTFMKQLKNRPLKLLVVILCIIYCNSRLKKCFGI